MGYLHICLGNFTLDPLEEVGGTLICVNHPYHFYPESKWIYFHLGYALPMGYLHICLGNFTPDPLGGSGLSYTNGLIVLMVSLMFFCWNSLVANEVFPLGSTLL